MRAAHVRRVASTWNTRPGSCLDTLASTGEVRPGCSSEVQALLLEVQAAGTYPDDDVYDLGALWEWLERTGPRPAQPAWKPRPAYLKENSA